MKALAVELLNTFDDNEQQESEPENKKQHKKQAQHKSPKLPKLLAGAIKVKNNKAIYKTEIKNIIEQLDVSDGKHYNFIEVFNESNALLSYYINTYAKFFGKQESITTYVNDYDNTLIPKLRSVVESNADYKDYLVNVKISHTEPTALYSNADDNEDSNVVNVYILDTNSLLDNIDVIMFYLHNAKHYMLFKNSTDKCSRDVLELYTKIQSVFVNDADVNVDVNADVKTIYKSANQFLSFKML